MARLNERDRVLAIRRLGPDPGPRFTRAAEQEAAIHLYPTRRRRVHATPIVPPVEQAAWTILTGGDDYPDQAA